MKKLGIGLAVLLLLLIGTVFIAPFVINVDKYRPQVVEMINKEINGTVELGKFSLSLWGQIRVEVEGLKVLDAQKKEIVSVKNAYFHIPFFSLFSGSPILTFKMDEPWVYLLKNSAGQLNVLSLVKKTPQVPSPSAPAVPVPSPTPSTPASPSAQGGHALPALLTQARLGIEMKNAFISYQDDMTGLKTQVKDLNVLIKDISMMHPTDLELWADLNTQMGKNTFRGLAKMTTRAEPSFAGTRLDHVNVTSRLDLDAVEIQISDQFQKKKGIPCHVETAVLLSEREVKIDHFTATFFNAVVKLSGMITNLVSSTGVFNPTVNLTVQSNEIEFKPWSELIPALKEYELGGSAKLAAEANGPSQKLGYSAQFNLNAFTAKAPKLKAQPKIDGVIHVSTDEIDKLLFTMKAPGNEIKLQGKLVSFARPQMAFEITSPGMDLDQLIEFPPPAPKKAGAAEGTKGPSSSSPAQPPGNPVDFDAMLDPLRQNKMLADLGAQLSVDIKMLKAKQVKVSDIQCKMAFKDLSPSITPCGFKVFSGKMNFNAGMKLKPKSPTYDFGMSVTGLDIKQAVESQMALFKNTLIGIADFSMKGEGSSFNPDPAVMNLKAHGNMKVEKATFATIDVMKMVSEAIAKSMNTLGEKIPALKGKSVGQLPSQTSKYDVISSDFSIQGGKFSAPNFFAKATPNQGIDIKGTTTVGIKDYSLSTFWEVIDTYNLTHLKDISVEQNGVKVEHLFSDGGAPVHFPMHANCTALAPCYSYTEVPEALGKVALSNIGKAVGARAKEELKKKAEEAIKRVAPPAVQEKAKGALKGLFR